MSLSRQELASKFLERLRREPGMETISEISISQINDPDVPANWRAVVLERDRPNVQAVLHAVARVTAELRQKYLLAT